MLRASAHRKMTRPRNLDATLPDRVKSILPTSYFEHGARAEPLQLVCRRTLWRENVMNRLTTASRRAQNNGTEYGPSKSKEVSCALTCLGSETQS